MPLPHTVTQSNAEQGNILAIILLAIVLIGALTSVISGTASQKSHIDDEELILHATKVQRQAAEFERGIAFIMQNGVSENDVRFAHPDTSEEYGDLSAASTTENQLFARDGGGAKYDRPPATINNGEGWEFFGHSALPDVGSELPELVAVLPNVSEKFCNAINRSLGYEGQPSDSSACIYDEDERFNNATQFSTSPNTTDENSFSQTPAMRACVECTSDGSYHYYHVLMAR